MYLEKFWKFFMVLEVHKLEYHRKLDFTALKYPKNNKFQHIFKTMIDCNIICKNVLFNYFAVLCNLNREQENKNSFCTESFEKLDGRTLKECKSSNNKWMNEMIKLGGWVGGWVGVNLINEWNDNKGEQSKRNEPKGQTK